MENEVTKANVDEVKRLESVNFIQIFNKILLLDVLVDLVTFKDSTFMEYWQHYCLMSS